MQQKTPGGLKNLKIILMCRKICILFTCLLFGLCTQAQKQNTLLERFKQFITGDFDNNNQVIAEIKAGKVEHPLSIHVNRVADDKIINKPNHLKGFFLLEESYYMAEGKPIELKPYLFFFELKENNIIHLTAYQLPKEYKKEEIRNDNKNLQFDYKDLIASPTFKGADYIWDPEKKTFSTIAPNDLGNGMRFTLIEIFTDKQLSVMELLEKDGKKITPWGSPIIYDRRKI